MTKFHLINVFFTTDASLLLQLIIQGFNIIFKLDIATFSISNNKMPKSTINKNMGSKSLKA